MKYDKQDQQGKAAFSKRNPQATQQFKNRWQGVLRALKRKQKGAQGRARTGQSLIIK
jgi:hypothetical protein